jgi:hypothetical protein
VCMCVCEDVYFKELLHSIVETGKSLSVHLPGDSAGFCQESQWCSSSESQQAWDPGKTDALVCI